MVCFKKLMAIVAGSLLLYSCQDFVSPSPDNTLTENEIKENATLAEGILMRAYQQLDGLRATNPAVATDDAVSNDEENGYRRMATGEWSSRFNPIGKWNEAYEAIYNLNYFINDLVDEVQWSGTSSYEQREFNKRLKGEAFALRALYQYRLLKNHGGMVGGNLTGFPIVEDVLGPDQDYQISRNSFQEALNQVLADADSALKYLPDRYDQRGEAIVVYGDRFRGRINGNIAQGIKSRATLLAASPAYGVVNWETAAGEAADLLTDIGGVSGLSATGNRFWMDQSDPEIIWRDDFNTNITLEERNFPPSLFGNGQINPSENLVASFPMQNGYPIDDPSSGYDPADPYADRDPRLSEYVIYNGMQYSNSTINTSTDDDVDGLNAQDNSTRTGYYMKKLMDQNVRLDPSGTNETRHFKTRMRYTEIFLNFAEAANEAWGPDGDPNGYGFTAREVIQAIRQRAGIAQPDGYLAGITSKEQMRSVIRNERRLELCFEGFRFWDLRRWDANLTEPVRGISISGTTLNEITVEERDYKDYMKYGPIPHSEVLIYDGLKQNDGW